MKGESAMSQDREFVAAVVRVLPELPEDVKQGWIENSASLARVLSEALMPPADKKNAADQLASWQVFYQKFFGLTLDLSGVKIPEKRAGFDWLIVVAQGLTPNRVFEVCQQHFPCWRYTDDLDAASKGRNDRESTQTYAIWVRDRQEADEELKGLSANDHRENKTPTETLLERLLHEFKYWSETGQHLDVENWTLCAGSRDSDGGMPGVSWRGDRLQVGCCSPVYHFGDLRARAAVPCQS